MPGKPILHVVAPPRRAYVELHCHSGFTFLDGAANPEELVARAVEFGYPALALTDRDGLYGVVRLREAAKDAGINPIFGAEITLEGGAHLTLLARTDDGYRSLSRLVTAAREGRKKGEAETTLDALDAHREGLVALSGCLDGELPRALARGDLDEARRVAGRYREIFGDGFYVEVQRHLLPDEDRVAAALIAFSRREGVDAVATNDARYTSPKGRRLHDALTAARLHTTLAEAGDRLRPNGEWRLKSADEMLRLFPNNTDLVARTVEIADRCRVDLSRINYRLPSARLPDGETEFGYLYDRVQEGVRDRYRPMTPEAAAQLAHELAMIERQKLAGYLLIVYDIVRFCRDRGILCQGRGSAANSAVCYALGITAVDPVKMNLLFERFISEGRSEPPDIDIDIAHQRREEVIQYVYERYGRTYAAMVAEVITYGLRSSARDFGKALGLTIDQVDRVAKALGRRASPDGEVIEVAAEVAGLDPETREVRLLAELCRAADGLPRHMSIHVGGMVISAEPIASVVPVEPAAMPNRTVIAWDKDDAAAAGLVKIDLLGLGMLSLIAEGIRLVGETTGTPLDIAKLDYEDKEVYEMLCRADTVGVFQVESRAQMNTLPRLKPKTFYDIVVEIAIIRPGPIQGGMVHPYLRRRAGREKVTYPHETLIPILERTLGVPLFQEQLMKVAVLAAGFTPSEADALRRAMGSKRSRKRMEELLGRLHDGMRANGYEEAAIESVAAQIVGFSSYGFPESHSASFAGLVFASAFLKHYYPVEFTAALYNAQPMGFYSPAVIAGDARRHGVRLLPVDVNHSAWDATIEGGSVRLGLRTVREVGGAEREALERALDGRPFASVAAFAAEALRCGVGRTALEALASAGAICGAPPREALWETLAAVRGNAGPLGVGEERAEPAPELAPLAPMQAYAHELLTTGVWVDGHPMELLRARLARKGLVTVAELAGARDGDVVEVAGIVVCRQRPPTARGMLFLTLEDETGLVNVSVPPATAERDPETYVRSVAIVVRGRVEREGDAIGLFAVGARDLLLRVAAKSRDFH